MITIMNRKVAGFEPRWAPFRGFSLLFDNPGSNLRSMEDVLKIGCSVDSSALELYRAFTMALDEIGRDLLINSYLFCPLTHFSYHVTAWGGVNERNIERMKVTGRPDFARFLANLPDSILDNTEFTRIINESPLVTRTGRPITFRFDTLSKWGNSVLVALVAPADQESEARLDQVKVERRKLNEKFEELFGSKTSYDVLSPHVSLGYFANKESAELTSSRIDNWADLVEERTRGLTITFGSISLYGFTDMVTFFKRP